MTFYVYILCSSTFDIFYVGQTNNLEGRLERHNNGYESFTSKYVPWEIVWYTTKASRPEALQLEKKLKNLSKERLIAFMKKYQ